MDENNSSISELADPALLQEALLLCADVLGATGRLSQSIPDYQLREAQLSLAQAIVRSVFYSKILLAEAGTGIGKTFAYLVPSLLIKKKIIISTASKTLQDQLFYKDLPLLVDVLGIAAPVENLKGRANYICRHRVELHANQSYLVPQATIKELYLVRRNLPQLQLGERSELTDLAEDSAVWPLVTSTAENCLGRECDHYSGCYLVLARKRAMEAQIVIINHHLFFADSRLKDAGFGELLPGADLIVFDEAHQLEEIGSQMNEISFSTHDWSNWLDDLIAEWPILDLANQPLKQDRFDLDVLLGKLVDAVDEKKAAFEDLRRLKDFCRAWEELLLFKQKMMEFLEKLELDDKVSLQKAKQRFIDLSRYADFFAVESSPEILWVERFKYSLVFHCTPTDSAPYFKALFADKSAALIFTSATLTIGGSFDHLIKALGLDAPDTLILASPFDFKKQVLMYLPRYLPDPHDAEYYDALLAQVLPVIEACEGRCFFLFTSHQALSLVAGKLAGLLDYPLLVQGEEPKSRLLARFRELGNAVLLATASFWEGVDVKGDALSCVIIDKLPFLNPTCPMIRGKMRHYQKAGLSGFRELSLPGAVLSLKQGVGRLIRDAKDKGILILADPRLTARDYGQIIFSSLPLMNKTRELGKVLQFIAEMKACHEIISH